MFPTFPMQAYPVPGSRIDTDERRAVARALTDALFNYLTLPITEMERAETIRLATPSVTVERIVQAQEQIDKVRDLLEDGRTKVETAMEGLHNAPEEMQSIARIQLQALYVDPLENQLKSMEEWLSGMQAEFEKGEQKQDSAV